MVRRTGDAANRPCATCDAVTIQEFGYGSGESWACTRCGRLSVDQGRRLWPIAVLWRWHERNYRRRYGAWTHSCPTASGGPGGWVLHIGPVKVRFG